MKAGTNVALGTDSAQWSELPGEMEPAAYGHAEALMDDRVFTPEAVLGRATINGARACGRDGPMPNT
jgi:cytosine/adenosine deaminase-related metal-dependent hydrolase